MRIRTEVRWIVLKDKLPLKNKLTYFFVFFIATSVFIIGLGAGFVAAVSRHEKVRDKEDYDQKLNSWSQTSCAYFKREIDSPSAHKIGDMVTPEDRNLIHNLNEVSPNLINAFIAGEDRYFHEHNGVVPYSILRAAFQQILGEDVTTGGSTITQQLVKNVILADNEKTYKRKTLEILNALRIERFYTKDEILTAYLNSVYFGKGVHHRHMYGVSSAAKGIFNKEVKDLNLAEAAYLAGMVQRPNAYIPFGPNASANLKRGIQRMKLILSQMLKYGYISEAQYAQACKVDIQKSLAKKSDTPSDYERYPYIINAVEREAMEILKKINYKTEGNQTNYRSMVRNGGFRIYTTIDQKIYDQMNDATKGMYFPKKYIHGKECREQLGAVLIDNKTGAILSFYAGPNFKENEKDHAFEAMNQPGSSIKPLLAYGPAINEGLISKNSIVVDEPLTKAYSSDVYVNANKKYSGPKTVAYALQWSLNIPAVKIFRELGIQRGFDYLRKMDLPPHKWDGEASVLGGMTNGYTVKQMTAAYAMIANNGVYNKAHLIDRITTANGKEIYRHDKINQSRRIFKEETTSELTEMLRAVVREGTAGSIGAQTGKYVIAGKTGTTNNDTDFWFVGYTPDITLGAWCGYDYKARCVDISKQAWIRFFKAAASAEPDLFPVGKHFRESSTDMSMNESTNSRSSGN